MITLLSIFIILVIITLTIKYNFNRINQLTKSNKIHLAFLSLINFMLIGKLVSITWDGNDKAVILLILGYLTLIILNGLVWLTLKILKKSEYKIYKFSTIMLVIIFVPTLILSSLY